MKFLRGRISVAALVGLSFVIAGEVRAAPSEPTKAELKIFWSSPEDPKPAKRRANAHFWAGNERELYIFYRDLKDLGGGYIGVGSDQCYLFVGWMKARYAWCIDYDDKIVSVHWVHQAFLKAAKTPKAFINLWKYRNRKAAKRVLQKAYAGDPRLKSILRSFWRARGSIFTRLYRMSIFMQRAKTPSYLSVQSQYDFVRKHVLARRVRPMLGNLMATTAVRSIGKAAKRLKVPIRVLYLSNAEQYWRRYPEYYRKNIRSLPYDKRSLVLRTFGKSKKQNLYTYQRQAATQYLSYLKIPSFRRVYEIHSHKVFRRRSVKFYVADPPRKPRKRRRRRRRSR